MSSTMKEEMLEEIALAPRPKVGKLSIRNAGKIYDPTGAKVVAMQDCNIEIEAGDFVAIVGPSGCGKSTLLNILAGFDNLTSGGVYLDEQPLALPDITPQPGSDRVVVFQNGALFPWMTVLENIMYGLRADKTIDKAEAKKKAMGFLEACDGLEKMAACYPSQLSSGMQRRVEIVRALINDPKILLLDEPFRAMDTVSKATMYQHLLRMFHICRKTIVFITHDLEEAIYLADKVIVMTTRPGTIKLKVDVDLPRPRLIEMMSSDKFLQLKNVAIEAVHEEAKKAFARNEREMA